ncbi:MAG TPA: 2,3-bisphosphoglycerate-dependent phosphoglycerate mutase [Bacteroidota bacterium]|nr:2,3-bisphosphoglycerate-dependent phosphoglycerate mutase [Bacteroidota bacterium]
MPTVVLLRHGESQWNLENRFTGWIDVPLSEKGVQEAKDAGEKLKGYTFDHAFTSVLKRANDTLNIVLEIIGQKNIPIDYNQALNERHYGDLQGLNKAETAKKYGDAQVKLWRRSFDVQPPNGESLKNTLERVLPYWDAKILPCIKKGERLIIAAHGNSLRSLVMHLDKLTQEQVLELNIPTGVPLVYEFDANAMPVSHKYI